MPLAPGTRISSYEIVELIGAGGMGEVYRARDLKLDREVAIKVLPELFASDPDRLARFEREARALAALNHPHIAHIHGFEDSGDVRALVMELADGEDLGERLRRGPVPLEDALAIARQIADALEMAHDRGIVHRDLKPANIKLAADGTVKILDFGLAKAVADAGDSLSGGTGTMANSPTFTSPMTQLGVILGTAAYMSPEQAKGKPVDRRTDIWALGVVLFEMLSGRHLFAGETPTETIAHILTQPPNFELLPAAVPPAVRRILRRCLEKDPKQRFQSAGDIRVEIDELGRQEPLPGVTEGAPSRRTRLLLPWVIAGVSTAAAVAAIWRAPAQPSPSADPIRVEARLDQRMILDVNVDGALAVLSPDGRMLVYAATLRGIRQLFVRGLADSEGKAIPGTEGATAPFFSPDGRSIAFFARAKLKRVSLSGGAPVEIADVIDGRGGTWGTNDIIVFSAATQVGLSRVSAAGGQVSELTTLSTGERSHRWPAFLPDSNSVLFAQQAIGAAYDDASIEIVNVETRERKVILRGGTYPRFVAPAHLVFVRGDALLAAPFDVAALETRGEPRSVLTKVLGSGGLGAGAGNGSAQIAVADNGTLAYVQGEVAASLCRLVVLDRSGKPTYTSPDLREFRDPHFAPDGNRIAVSANVGQSQHIFVLDLTRRVMTRVTFDGTSNGLPIWTPDGRELAYFSDRGGQDERSGRGGSALLPYITRADGAGEPRPLLKTEIMTLPMSFSPDGKFLAVMQQDARTTIDSAIVELATGKLVPFGESSTSEIVPVFSPDGRWIAYQEGAGTATEVYIRSFPGPAGRWQVSVGGGGLPAWSKNGREIVYISGADTTRVMAVDVEANGEALKIGQPITLFTSEFFVRPSNATWFDVSRDGSRLVALHGDEKAAGGMIDHVTFIFNFPAMLR